MENKNKKKRLPSCIICGKIARTRLILHNTVMDWPPYVICLECAGETKKTEEEEQNAER